MTTLLALPTELILRVLAEVEPLDLIRMSQVCKLTSDILADRAVWEDAVRRVYREHSLFEPSFQPLDSLGLDGLRKAALRPHLFHTKVSKAPGEVYPTLQRTLEHNIEQTRRSDFFQAHMIPGGRYLIGLADTYLCLWDLGPPGTTPSGPLVEIAHSESLNFELYSMSTPSQSSHDSYRFAIHGQISGINDSQVVWVYEVNPLQNNHGFRLLATLALGDGWDLGRFWLSGDRVYLARTSGLFIVWDFVGSRIISWFLPDLSARMRRRYTLVDIGDVIILLHTADFYAWRVPTLRHMEPHSNWAANHFVVDPPFHRAPYKNDRDTSPSSTPDVVLRPSSWTSFNPHARRTFDLMQRDPFRIKSLELCLRAPGDEKGVEATVLCAAESGSWLESCAGQIGTRYYSAGGSGHYVMIPSPRRGVSIITHYSAPGAEGNPLWQSVVEHCLIEHSVDTISLICPYSGRFAYTCANHHGDGYNRIHVVDLLSV